MTFRLTELPYDRDALEPYISANTLDYHYGKHHKAYVDKLNKNVAGTAYEDMALEDVIRKSFEKKDTPVYNNASQAWNHTFLWDSMAAAGDGKPTGSLSDIIDDQFDGLEGFRKQFKESATAQFGSGWTWLIADGDTVSIVSTSNADSPLTSRTTPAPYPRCLGTRVLPGLPEQPRQVCRRVSRAPHQLGLRPGEPRRARGAEAGTRVSINSKKPGARATCFSRPEAASWCRA